MATLHDTSVVDPVTRVGMLTPSSNTVLEPMCAAMLDGLPDVSVHFARFRVTEIGLSEAANSQFDHSVMLQAAGLLADARVHAVCWNGTSAAWLGLERDRTLSRAITAATGLPATSAVLAMVEILQAGGLSRIGIVTPYVDAVQDQIGHTLATEGLAVVTERHLGLSENFAFATVGEAQLGQMIREVATARPQAILVLCTNLRGAAVAERLEAELDIPVLDSVATSMWGALRCAGAEPARLIGWGRLFRMPGASEPLPTGPAG